MGELVKFQTLLLVLLVGLAVIPAPGNGQSNAICTEAMIRSFGPCINFITSGSNISSPSSDCCSSLKDLIKDGQDCVCLIVTGGVPFQVPINRSLAISLPRACKMSGVPIECKGESGQNLSPSLSPPRPTGPLIPLPVTPPSFAPEDDLVPTLTPPGMRPTLMPSAADVYPNVLPFMLFAVFITLFMNCS